MTIIENGNFSSTIRIFLWAAGIIVSITSCVFLEGKFLLVGLTLGMITTAAGTYSEMANFLGLTPFGNCHKAARKTYERESSNR